MYVLDHSKSFYIMHMEKITKKKEAFPYFIVVVLHFVILGQSHW